MDILTRVLATLSLGMMLVGPAHAIGISYVNKYGETVDRGETSVVLTVGDGMALVCPRGFPFQPRPLDGRPVDGRIRMVGVKATPELIVTGGACTSLSANAGVLTAGAYEVTAEIRSATGALLETTSDTLHVRPIGTECNGDPALSPSVVGFPGLVPATDFVSRVVTDPGFAAAIGNPAVRVDEYGYLVLFDFQPLEDVPVAMERLERNFNWPTFDPDWGVGGIVRNVRACPTTPGVDTVGTIVEYFNTALDHYFYTGDAGEIAAIDAGKVGPGWLRTGKSFAVVSTPGCAFEHGQTVVYRFNGIPGTGPNSHFFTRDRAECAVVDKSAKWSFEGIPFWASAPRADGTCAELPSAGRARVPLYRAWRPNGDSNHRFSTERAVIEEMVTKGWVDEGVAMCVLAQS